MNKKQVVTLLIVTNVISISLVSLFLISGRSQKENPAVSRAPDSQPAQSPQTAEKPQQTIKVELDSIIAQYDVIKAERFQDSTKAYIQAIRQEPPYTADSITRAKYYIDQGYYDKAIEICEEEIQESSHWPADFYTLAWIYAKLGRYAEAIEISRKTIQEHPNYSKIWHILGWVYAKQGEQDKAVDACKRALELEPSSALTHYGLGRIYGMVGNNEKAIESYKETLRLKPDFAEAYLFEGLAYTELGNRKQAMECYLQAIASNRHYLEPYFFLGVAYDESGQYKKAIESFEEAARMYNLQETKTRIQSVGIKPDIANIYCVIGVCHLRLGEYLEASGAFKKAVDIDDAHGGAHYGLALASLLFGDKDKALSEYEQVKILKGEEAAKPLFEIIRKYGK